MSRRGGNREKDRPLYILIVQLVLDLARIVDDIRTLWGKLKGED